jgi:general secretion pathway protein H
MRALPSRRPASKRRTQRAARGFTLIELSISILILGLLLAGVLPAIDGVTGVRAREAAGKLTGMVRYMYNESALTGRPCRMTFDMDARAYWSECTDAHFTLSETKVESRDGVAVEDRPKSDNFRDTSDSFALDSVDGAKAEHDRIEKAAAFSDFTTEEIKKQTLPTGVELSVWVDHQTEKFVKGKSYLYFFPQGYTERAQIYLTSGTTTYTIKVQPLTGKAKVEPSELELPRDVR